MPRALFAKWLASRVASSATPGMVPDFRVDAKSWPVKIGTWDDPDSVSVDRLADYVERTVEMHPSEITFEAGAPNHRSNADRRPVD
jgi:methylaspartate ammonia-lyase